MFSRGDSLKLWDLYYIMDEKLEEWLALQGQTAFLGKVGAVFIIPSDFHLDSLQSPPDHSISSAI